MTFNTTIKTINQREKKLKRVKETRKRKINIEFIRIYINYSIKSSYNFLLYHFYHVTCIILCPIITECNVALDDNEVTT